MIGVSVVLIGKNEEKNIEKCVKSVEEALVSKFDYEIIYVDSDSKDKTLDIVRKYNIKVYKLDELEKMTASKGRYVGALLSSKEYILFLDADMELFDGWLEKAINVISEEPFYAGIIGIRNDVVISESKTVSVKENCYNTTKLKPTSHFGGAVLFKKKDLILAGNYSPNIIANEEAELHSRIMQLNKVIVEIPEPMINHYIPIEKANTTLKQVILGKRQLGIGQGFASALRSNSLVYFVRRFKFFFTSLTIDILSFLMLMFGCIYGPSIFYYILFFQLVSFLICILFRRWYYYFLDKVQAVFFIPGILSFKDQSKVNFTKIN